MGHSSFSGGGGQSSRGSHLDFVSYWADKTVEDAVLQGQQLRLQKPHPLPSREYDVVNIDFIKPPCNVRNSRRRRKKVPKASPKRHRSGSPSKVVASKSSSRKGQKRQASKLSCGMRIAELAVPTKRHCLETWKSMYNTLPDYMIERLRQHILDQRPVVEISDAIHCFKRRCKRHKKTEKPSNKTVERRNKKIKYPLQRNEVKVLGAIFGHRIAKKLIIPLNIILNSDLEKMASVISYDIEALMRKSKSINARNKMYKMIETDVVKKVTIWVSDVLEESSDKILEDQLKEFEEEAGPALDCIDDLVDNVLDICIPIPETFYISESDESGSDIGVLDTQISSKNFDTEEAENIEDHFMNELVTLINNIGNESDLNIGDWQSNGDVEENNNADFVEAEEGITIKQENIEQDTDFDQEETEDLKDVETDAEEQLHENAEIDDTDIKNDEQEGNEDLKDVEIDALEQIRENAEIDDTDIKNEEQEKNEDLKDVETDALEQIRENAETDDTDIKNEDLDADVEEENKNDSKTNLLDENVDGRNDEKYDEYLESEDIAPTEVTQSPLENNDEIETFADATGEDKAEDDLLLSEDMDKKVKFGDSVTSEQRQDLDLNWKASIEQMEFAEPNKGDADESWPDVQPPLLRPSQSVIKSITSLGQIREVDEKISKPEANEYVENERQEAVETLASEIEKQIKPADSSEKSDKKSTTNESIKSKDETASKGSGKKDKTSISKRFSDSRKNKSPSKTTTPSSSQRSPSKTIKISSSSSPTRPAPKTLKKIIDKNIKSKKDAESTRSSRSTKDLESDVTTKEKFLPKVKPKPDYRVNINTAPAWLNRNFSQPSCSCVHIASKTKVNAKPKVNENLVRKWCQDLEYGYENLKMWNKWVENTTRTVCMLQREIANSYCPERCSNKEWIKLKRNIDKDAHLWTKLNQHTQEKLQGYKRMYQKRSNTPSNYFVCCSLDK